MAKRPKISFAKPQGDTAGSSVERVDVLEKALGEAKEATQPAPASVNTPKPQRSRKGLVSTSIWSSKDARLELKIHAQTSETTMERYIIEAVNEKLERDGVDFRIG